MQSRAHRLAHRRTVDLFFSIVLGASILLLAGCSTDPQPRADYRPAKTDAQIYREIAQLPHVTDVDIRWVDDANTGNTYTGIVRVTQTRYVVDTLDHVNALLRQGRFSSYLTVGVRSEQNPLRVANDAVGLSAPAAVEHRYGPQPGTGEPPTNEPLPSVDATSGPIPSPITRVPSP